jgi:hypothetical protein
MTAIDRLRTLVTRLVATEPVALVAAGVALLGLVGIQVADADADAATDVLVVVLPLLGAVIARRAVTPTTRAVEAEQQAVADTISALADGHLDPYVHRPGGDRP